MNISDIQNGSKKVDVAGFIQKKGEIRTVNLKAGGTSKVCNATLSDSSGSIELVLWNDDIDRVSENSVVAISNGYASTYKDQLQLSVGRYGSMKVEGE